MRGKGRRKGREGQGKGREGRGREGRGREGKRREGKGSKGKNGQYNRRLTLYHLFNLFLLI